MSGVTARDRAPRQPSGAPKRAKSAPGPRRARAAVPDASDARRGVAQPMMRGYLPHYLSRLMNLLNLRLIRYLQPLDMTVQQFRVMQILAVGGHVRIGDIARDAVIEQPVASRVVDQLEKRNFAARRKRPTQARIGEVSLTPLGRAVLQSLTPHANAIVQDATGALTQEQNSTLRDLLARMFEHVIKTRSPAPRTAAARLV